MEGSEYLNERGDLGFRLVALKDGCERASQAIELMLEECPVDDEAALPPQIMFSLGWAVGALERDLAMAATTLDMHCPELDPAPSARIGVLQVDAQLGARAALESCAQLLGKTVETLAEITSYLVNEIDEEIPVSHGPDDEAIQAWLCSAPEPQP